MFSGDENGISLWSKMSVSNDPEEKEFYKRVCEAAPKHGKVYFSDCIEQRETKSNQATYCMEWNGMSWNITLLYLPENAKSINYNKPPEVKPDDVMWAEIDPNDVLPI